MHLFSQIQRPMNYYLKTSIEAALLCQFILTSYAFSPYLLWFKILLAGLIEVVGTNQEPVARTSLVCYLVMYVY